MNQSKKHLFKYTILAISIPALQYCSSTMPLKVPATDSKSAEAVKAFFKGQQPVIGVVSARPSRQQSAAMDFEGDWASLMESKVESALVERQYYKIVDLANRKERLRQLAHSQSGLTSQALRIGKELATKSILVITLTNAPKTECKIEKEMNKEHPVGSLLSGLVDTPKPGEEQGVLSSTLNTTVKNVSGVRDTGIRYFSLFIQAKLINVETGQSISHSFSAPYRHANQAGNLECPSVLEALNKALEYSAKLIAQKLSPNLIEKEVPILVDVSDLPDPVQDQVANSLNSGLNWASAGDMSQAREAWQRALSASGNRSLSANWNLALYYWSAGDSSKAQSHFKRFFDSDNQDFIDAEKRKLWAEFKQTNGIK